MIIIGCDFHTRYQQIAMADDETASGTPLVFFDRPGGLLFAGLVFAKGGGPSSARLAEPLPPPLFQPLTSNLEPLPFLSLPNIS